MTLSISFYVGIQGVQSYFDEFLIAHSGFVRIVFTYTEYCIYECTYLLFRNQSRVSRHIWVNVVIELLYGGQNFLRIAL